MFVINNSESKINKILMVVFTISAIIGLVCQIMNILALTKTKLGKLVRKNLIGSVYDFMDESIDEACTRMPKWMSKLNSLEQ